jgi:molybdopterin-guanine dinucleotide biosynthesis protein A
MKNKYKDITCAVLAGGKSRRMNGENKALIEIGQHSNLEKIIRLSEKYFFETILIANNHNRFDDLKNLKVYSDLFKNVGPLGGIHSALVNSSTEFVFLLPCDMPFISERLVLDEVDQFRKQSCDIIVPRIGDFFEPLHSIYSVKVADKLEYHIQNTKDLSVRSFFSSVKVHYWDLENTEEIRRSFININTHKDIELAIEILKAQKDV